MIILDTDVLINILDKKHTPIQSIILDKLEEYKDEEIVTTALNLEEFLYGVFKRDKKVDLSHPIFQLEILPFCSADAVRSTHIENELEKLGKKKPRGDILIASIALEHNSRIFTLNTTHFQEIEGLALIEI